MPTISKIRFTNVIYENGGKRYNDDIFEFDGHNGAILLENGGGKTVFIQTAIQAILPHSDLAERKIKETLMLEGGPCHIAIEWILNERPRRYALTAVSLYRSNQGLASLKYAYEYGVGDDHAIEKLPFIKTASDGKARPSGKGEINEYYQYMKQQHMAAQTFDTIKDFQHHIEEDFKIIPSEWRKVALINGAEGGVEDFFDGCKTTGQLVDKLLIPVVEEALAGNGTDDFVSTFEKQREHFKKHKQLRARIEESKVIEEQITSYVDLYTRRHEEEQTFMVALEKAKALYRYAVEEEHVNQRALEENQRAQDSLQEKRGQFEHKEASYKIAVLKQDYEKLKNTYDGVKEAFDAIEGQYRDKAESLQNLQIAQIKTNLKETDHRIERYEGAIEALDQDEDIQKLQEALERNAGQLKAYFEDTIHELTKALSILEGQRANYDSTLEAQRVQLKNKKAQAQDYRSKLADVTGRLDQLQKDMKQIADGILANPLHEKIETEQPKWLKRIATIENNKVDYHHAIKDLEDEKERLQDDRPHIQKDLDATRGDYTDCNHALEAMEEAQEDILARLKLHKPQWQTMDTLYKREQTILETLEGQVEKIRREKETCLLKERVAYRFLDSYGEHIHFTAEPLLEKWVTQWAEQFKLLTLGTDYIEKMAPTLGKSLEACYEAYRFWPIAVMTTRDEVDKLLAKIEEKKDALTYPIAVITDDEASQLLKRDGPIEETLIIPGYWSQNSNRVGFERWKNDLLKEAKATRSMRQGKEGELGLWDSLLKATRTYYERYPYDWVTSYQKERRQLEEKIHGLEEALQEKNKRIVEIDREVKQYNNTLRDLDQEYAVMSHKIQQANSYLNKKRDHEGLTRNQNRYKQQLQRLEEECGIWANKIEVTTDILEGLKADIHAQNGEIKIIKMDSLYAQVKNERIVPTTSNRRSLEEERRELTQRLNKEQKGRQHIEADLNRERDNAKRLNRELKQRRKQALYPIDENILYAPHGEEAIDRLIEDTNRLKDKIDQLKPELHKSDEDLRGKKSEYTLRLDDFHRFYEALILFKEALQDVAKAIEKERSSIIQEEKALKSVENRLEKEKQKILKAKHGLEVMNGRFGYLKDHIKEQPIAETVKQEYPYNRQVVIKQQIDSLEALATNVNTLIEKVSRRREGFIRFCDETIHDPRLKEMAVSGIKAKKVYKDILDWQRKMQNRIARIIEIAEHDMREHDKELQQFINHLYTYLIAVAQELRNIPKKTRIKVDEGWKEVFLFKVPTWEEQAGKEELRRHIDWMIKQLEGDAFKDEEGNEDDALMKKSIEKWLDTKQLLQNVMKHDTIKVKCRKVTNDGKVNSTPISWEKSNLWSGGEKWSKNMTLFLGILNYLAEKRQHITGNQKRHRTVMMDNPFGKASSDHVLDPVFFIAEQLGFQIIALTAHAEGKFIRDYFPIVYSCRLRETTNREHQIVTKEKEIRYAYFKDHDPRALERLGEQEQMAFI